MCSTTENLRSNLRNKLLDASAQATVEAAFVLPILMLLVLLLLQPAIVLYDRIVMESAAAEGCRLIATAESSNFGKCDDYIRRRLSAVPQLDMFHVHSTGCTWSISFTGSESSDNVGVKITNEAKPLPLLGLGAQMLGLVNSKGNLVIEASASAKTQPDWAIASAAGTKPEEWIGI